ncbi:MAG TPA: S8 family peptidase [Steroidobacteraceae bacterium]|nr:S8 family peptidase [Steroidobacteraceae bacterium]
MDPNFKRRTGHLGLIAVAVLVAAPASAAGRSDLVAAALSHGTPHVSDELIVQFHAGFGSTEQSRALARIGGRPADVVAAGARRNDGKGDLVVVKLPRGLAVAAAMRGLATESIIEFAEPNWIYQHTANSNDPYYTKGSLWGMYGNTSKPSNQYGSQAGDAQSNDCSSVWVGIIDEGYMFTHADLSANAGKNPGETGTAANGSNRETNGVDDDGNGLIDDVRGWDFVNNDNSVFDGLADDHGTHVAGTIGGVGNNSQGVSGVCWTIKLLNAKFLGNNGGTTANAIKSVDYFTDLKKRHSLNMIATSNSWGGGGFSQGLTDAIKRANDAGMLFVAAAGNSSVDCDTSSSCYPAEYGNANIIAVASLDSNGAMSSFSNWGAKTIDIGAPGRGIISTVPVRSRGNIVGGYASYSGTSMATPHVSGAAALYKQRNPSATASQVKSAIMNSTQSTTSLNGRVVSNGRLDVSNF